MAKCTPQRLDFPFVGVLLPLGNLERFQDFLHVIQSFAQGLDDSIDLTRLKDVAGRARKLRSQPFEADCLTSAWAPVGKADSLAARTTRG